VIQSPLPPPPAHRSQRPVPQRCLRALAKAGLCLLAAEALRQMIEQGAHRLLLEGEPELAADALRMLWCPALLAAAGALFLLQTLLLVLLPTIAAVAAPRPHHRHVPAPPPPRPRRPVRPVEPHLQACIELGLPPGSNWHEIHEHWRRQVSHWHPDRGGDVQLWHQRLAAYRLLREREQRRAAALG